MLSSGDLAREGKAVKPSQLSIVSERKQPPDTDAIEIQHLSVNSKQIQPDLHAHELASVDPDFQKLCEEFYTPLYRYILRRVGDPGHAEDIVQETLLDASAKWHTLQRDNEKALLKWLYTTARNNFIDHCRREDIRSRRWCSYEQTLISQPEDSDPFQASEIEEDIWQVLGQLPERERECILLICQDGYRIEEAAAILHIQPGSVRGYLSRGREKFRKIYQVMQAAFFKGARTTQNGRSPA